MHQHYDDYKDADPGSIGWAMERQIFDWVVPFHEGSISYLRAIGMWSDPLDAHNDALIARQGVLLEAWQAYNTAAAKQQDKADFAKGWMRTRATALQAAGLDPVWN